jgi:hypothetical protein
LQDIDEPVHAAEEDKLVGGKLPLTLTWPLSRWNWLAFRDRNPLHGLDGMFL